MLGAGTRYFLATEGLLQQPCPCSASTTIWPLQLKMWDQTREYTISSFFFLNKYQLGAVGKEQRNYKKHSSNSSIFLKLFRKKGKEQWFYTLFPVPFPHIPTPNAAYSKAMKPVSYGFPPLATQPTWKSCTLLECNGPREAKSSP